MDGYVTIKLSAQAYDEFSNAIFKADDPVLMDHRFERPALIRGPIRLDHLRLEVKDDNDWQKRLEKEVAAQNPTHEAVRSLTDTPPKYVEQEHKMRFTAEHLNRMPAEDEAAFHDYMGRIGYRDADIAQQAYFAGKHVCRRCGCTDGHACLHSGPDKKYGLPCRWVEPDLCSACDEVLKDAAFADGHDHLMPYTEFGKAANIAAWTVLFVCGIAGAIALGASLYAITEKVWP